MIEGTLNVLVDHLRKAMRFRNAVGVVDTIVAKYWATVVGYMVVSRPFLDLTHPRHLKSSPSEIMEDYYRSGRMLVNMASAIGRLVLAGRDLTRLAGFTSRVSELMSVLDDLGRGNYKRTMVTQKKEGGEGEGKAEDEKGSAAAASSADEASLPPIKLNSGVIVESDDMIDFDRVPLVTPNGDVLVRALTFRVEAGMNVLVSGPNGCGKSSLFRILGELWPVFGGTVTKPNRRNLFYVPQRPYMTLGTLRDQIIYPHSRSDITAKDDEIIGYLARVNLDYLATRAGGLDAVEDWMDVLSGGEKQRLAMARLFFNKPKWAVLDECTSAVSVDVEGRMYAQCKELGITLFTVSHRKSLWAFHEYVLSFDGRGGFAFNRITDDLVIGS